MLEALFRTLFTKLELFLLRNQKKFVLNRKQQDKNQSSDSDADVESLFKQTDESVNYEKLLKGTQPKGKQSLISELLVSQVLASKSLLCFHFTYVSTFHYVLNFCNCLGNYPKSP